MTPEVVDVTLRDGGYVNNWDLSDGDAERIVSTLSRAGVPYIEVGYYRPRQRRDRAGRRGAACCPQDYLEVLTRVRRDAQLLVMVHHSEVDRLDYECLADHGVSRVRLVVSPQSVEGMQEHVPAILAGGLSCSVNLIRISRWSEESLRRVARIAEDLGADWIYLADSNGSMFPNQVGHLVAELRKAVHVRIGFHGHDPLRLAFANSVIAAQEGCTLIDSSLGGMGKGVGNLATELAFTHARFSSRDPVGSHTAEMAEVVAALLDAWLQMPPSRRYAYALAALLDLSMDDLKDITARGQHPSSALELVIPELQLLMTERPHPPHDTGVDFLPVSTLSGSTT